MSNSCVLIHRNRSVPPTHPNPARPEVAAQRTSGAGRSAQSAAKYSCKGRYSRGDGLACFGPGTGQATASSRSYFRDESHDGCARPHHGADFSGARAQCRGRCVGMVRTVGRKRRPHRFFVVRPKRCRFSGLAAAAFVDANRSSLRHSSERLVREKATSRRRQCSTAEHFTPARAHRTRSWMPAKQATAVVALHAERLAGRTSLSAPTDTGSFRWR